MRDNSLKSREFAYKPTLKPALNKTWVFSGLETLIILVNAAASN